MNKIHSFAIVCIEILMFAFHGASAQWVQTNGPWGGDIHAFAVSGSTILAGTDASGVFISTNDGTSWTAADSGLTADCVQSLAASDSTIWAGTSTGVFCSINNGTDWVAVNSGLTNTLVTFLAVSSGMILAGTWGSGIFGFIDNGTSGWVAANSGIVNANIWTIAVSGNTIFTGTNGEGIFRSDNNDNFGWTASNSGLPVVDVLSMAARGNTVFAGTNGDGVFVSCNSGTSWTEVNSGLLNRIVNNLAASDSNIFAGTYPGGVWKLPFSQVTKVFNREQRREPSQQLKLKILAQNHANSKIIIEIFLPYSDRVSIKICDLSGRGISTLVNNYSGPGPHSCFLDARNLSPGFYTVKMQACGKTTVRTMPVFR